MPDIRVVARSCRELSAPEVTRLLRYAYHEERLLAVFILIEQFQKGDARKRMRIFRLYMRNRKWINNWDLVDVSAPYIVGPQLEHADRSLLYDLARSRGLWDRRIAVLTTLYFIRQGEYGDSIALCTRLLNDSEDLIHKACGWMLREIGKRDRRVLERFLDRHAAVMPRTMLRYAVERLPATSRRIHMAARAHGR